MNSEKLSEVTKISKENIEFLIQKSKTILLKKTSTDSYRKWVTKPF